MNGTEQLLQHIFFFHTDSICSEDLPPLPTGSDVTKLHQGMRLSSVGGKGTAGGYGGACSPRCHVLTWKPLAFPYEDKAFAHTFFTSVLAQPFAVLLPHVATTGEEPRGSS